MSDCSTLIKQLSDQRLSFHSLRDVFSTSPIYLDYEHRLQGFDSWVTVELSILQTLTASRFVDGEKSNTLLVHRLFLLFFCIAFQAPKIRLHSQGL